MTMVPSHAQERLWFLDQVAPGSRRLLAELAASVADLLVLEAAGPGDDEAAGLAGGENR